MGYVTLHLIEWCSTHSKLFPGIGLRIATGILLLNVFQFEPQASASPQSDNGDEITRMAKTIETITSQERTCHERRAALSPYWESLPLKAQLLTPHITKLKGIVLDEQEPFELRADILHAIASCGLMQQEVSCVSIINDVMANPLVDRRLRLASAMHLAVLPNNNLDVDDVVSLVINYPGSDEERCEALGYCIDVVSRNPKETGEFHRRMLLLSIDETESEAIRCVALSAFQQTAGWLCDTDNRRDFLSTQRLLLSLMKCRETPDALRVVTIFSACTVLLADPKAVNERQIAEVGRAFATFLVRVVNDPTESTDVHDAAMETIVMMLPFIDEKIVTTLASALENDSPKVVQKSVIATLDRLKSIAAPSIPALKEFVNQTGDIELRSAANKAIASISSGSTECD